MYLTVIVVRPVIIIFLTVISMLRVASGESQPVRFEMISASYSTDIFVNLLRRAGRYV